MVNSVVNFPDGKWISNQLRAHGIQQKELAAALGFHASGATRLLNGARPLRTSELPALVSFLRSRGVGAFSEAAIQLGLRRAQDLGAMSSALRMPHRRLVEIAQGAKMDDEEVARLAFIVDSAIEERRPPVGAVPGSAADMVPVYAAPRWIAGGWSQGQLRLVETRPAPPRLVGSSGGFGMYIETDSLIPMFRPGDIAYMLPGVPTIVGSRALAQTQDDRWAFGIIEPGPRSPVLRWHERHRPIALPPEISLFRVVAVDFQ